MIDVKDVLTLEDDKKYVVVSKIDYENKVYFYLVGVEEITDVKFGYIDNDEFVEINDKELVTKLLPHFYKDVKNNLPKKD